MVIKVERFAIKPTYTIGKMYINGKYFCDTLEDTDRKLNSQMSKAEIAAKKVYGKTAIPAGEYKTITYFWAKHKRYVPALCDVLGFSGILIHNGANANDTLGCILVGENKVVGGLINGKKYMVELTDMVHNCEGAKEKVTTIITYKN